MIVRVTPVSVGAGRGRQAASRASSPTSTAVPPRANPTRRPPSTTSPPTGTTSPPRGAEGPRPAASQTTTQRRAAPAPREHASARSAVAVHMLSRSCRCDPYPMMCVDQDLSDRAAAGRHHRDACFPVASRDHRQGATSPANRPGRRASPVLRVRPIEAADHPRPRARRTCRSRANGSSHGARCAWAALCPSFAPG